MNSIKAKIEERKICYKIPRYLVIIITKLGMSFQPSRQGSSIYRKPCLKKVPKEQKDWKMPVGTLRLSDHWNFQKYYWDNEGTTVFCTDKPVPERTWALAINTGWKVNPWKVLYILNLEKGKNITNIDCKDINQWVKIFTTHYEW